MAFAKDSDMTMVRFKNVRSMWLGETERNLENLLEILPTLKPVVVFVDEIDQMMSARGMAGQATSHEVEQHVLARLLEFMGDDSHRGEILWIGATNRPDLLDAAMLRRFDRVLPFMNPGREQVKGLVKDLGNVLQLELQDTLGSTRTDTWDQVYDLMVERNMSCDAIQKTIRHASELASLVNDGKTIYPKDALGAVYDYIQNHDPTRYLFMCLHSLAAISFVTDIPWDKKDDVPEELGDYFDFGSDKAVVGVNRSAIENKLREIRLYV